MAYSPPEASGTHRPEKTSRRCAVGRSRLFLPEPEGSGRHGSHGGFPHSLSRSHKRRSRAGNSNIRNPILVSYVAKGLLPYHGLGSGIKRALELWPQIEFIDDHDGCLFTATLTRKPAEELDLVEEDDPRNAPKSGNEPTNAGNEPTNAGNEPINVPKNAIDPINDPRNAPEFQILEILGSNPTISYDELAEQMQKGRSTIMRYIAGLKASGRLKRIGPKKGGHWEVIQGEYSRKTEP